MKRLFLISLITLFSYSKSDACSCSCPDDCSFSRVSKSGDFVALVKVISFDAYLDSEITGHKGKMPYAMTVEIIKKYKGSEKNKKIRIWGDNGMLCRPYLAYFEVGKYYLIAPSLLPKGDLPINKDSQLNNYDFFACSTDFLKVDIEKNKAYGKYSNNFESILTMNNLEEELRKKMTTTEIRNLYELSVSYEQGASKLLLREIKENLLTKPNKLDKYEKEIDLDEFETKLFEKKIKLDINKIQTILLNILNRTYIWSWTINIITILVILFTLFKVIRLRKKN